MYTPSCVCTRLESDTDTTPLFLYISSPQRARAAALEVGDKVAAKSLARAEVRLLELDLTPEQV